MRRAERVRVHGIVGVRFSANPTNFASQRQHRGFHDLTSAASSSRLRDRISVASYFFFDHQRPFGNSEFFLCQRFTRPNGGHHRRGQHHATCLQTDEPCWVSPVHAIVGWRNHDNLPSERRHRACPIERKRSRLRDGVFRRGSICFGFQKRRFSGNRAKNIWKF